jgi:hypothetical protein
VLDMPYMYRSAHSLGHQRGLGNCFKALDTHHGARKDSAGSRGACKRLPLGLRRETTACRSKQVVSQTGTRAVSFGGLVIVLSSHDKRLLLGRHPLFSWIHCPSPLPAAPCHSVQEIIAEVRLQERTQNQDLAGEMVIRTLCSIKVLFEHS